MYLNMGAEYKSMILNPYGPLQREFVLVLGSLENVLFLT
jgi:hypothetical protein